MEWNIGVFLLARFLKEISTTNFIDSCGSSVIIATAYWLDGPFDSRQASVTFLFSKISRPALGPTQPYVQRVLPIFFLRSSGRGVNLTLRLLMSYIYMELLVKPDMLTSYIYGPTFGNAETVSFYLLHNVSTLNQCREVSCVTFVCKHFAS